jgi:uncharacterized membrane protein
MQLNTAAKVIVGLLTALVALFPLGLVFLWLASFFPMMSGWVSEFPSPFADALFAIMFPMMCLVSFLMYAMVAFYVTHAIKNTTASDLIRILAILLVFFFPYVGMPAYYVLFILLAKPPSWALKTVSPAP